MADFVFGDFSEQEAEKLFDNDKQGVKFPWSTDDCMTSPIEFGFDIPPVISPSGGTGVSYSCNGSLSHQESTNSALTSPPYSSKSSSVENVKITKQSSSSSHQRHHSDRKLKKKRPPGYYTQEYQQMLEPATLENDNQNDINEQTPKIEQNPNDERYISCDQWVDSTMQHQHDDKQSTNDEDETESDSRETTTDTDNDNDHPQTITIHKTTILNNNNETSLYSTSVASAASIETLKPSSDNLSSSVKSKPVSWAALFRGSQPATTTTTTTTTTNISQVPQPQQSSPVQKVQSTSSSSSQQQQNGGRNPSTSNSFHSKPNYHVYNSNGEDSRTLEDYFSKCEVRPSAMAIKPRGLLNKSNYCYVNATLQSLLACPAFFNVMKYIPLNEDTDNHNVPCIRALHTFVNQFEKMDRSKSSSNHKDIICGQSFEATEVLQELSRLRSTPIELIKSKQEDAHELLCQLLSEIHDEICQILYNPSTNKNEESTSSSDLSTTTADLQLNGDEKSEDWLQVGKRNRTHVLRTNEIRKSLITDIFAGKFRSTVQSPGNQRSVVHEPFFTLSLDIKDPKITTLDEALLRFCEQSAVSDYVDSKNRQNIHTNKTMLIEQLPPILIIHLKCFLYDEADGIKKINKSVNYTVNLTLPKNILTEQARRSSHDRYKLFAVEYHQGDHATKGHYITDVFHPGLQGWLRFDDGNVHVVTSNQVINPTADKLTPYLLFYRRD